MIRPNRYKSPKMPIFMCSMLVIKILDYYKIISAMILIPISVIVLATVNIVQESNSDKSKTKKFIYIALNVLLIIAAIIVLIKFMNWKIEHMRWRAIGG